MTYDIAQHPSLSAAAVALRDAGGGSASEPSAAFTVQATDAEVLLGLNGTAFTGADADSARTAVALQTNFQVELSTGRVATDETVGERRTKYAEGDVHPQAARIAARLLGTLAPAAPKAHRRRYGTGSVRTQARW